jgi:hypothetical protein
MGGGLFPQEKLNRRRGLRPGRIMVPNRLRRAATFWHIWRELFSLAP